MLTTNEIVAHHDRRTEDIEVPEWGGIVRLMEPSAFDRERFASQYNAQKKPNGDVDPSGLMALLVSMCLVDEGGRRLFTTTDDLEALNQKSVLVLERLFERCRKLAGLTDESLDETVGN